MNDSTDAVITLPVRPEWKQPKHEADRERYASFKALKVNDALPQAGSRIAFLAGPDAQLTSLLDYLQYMGIPMGSETWASRAISRIQHLKDIHRATMQLLREYSGPENQQVERLRDEITHARQMLAKATPETETKCDCCGWPGARLIGNGWAACNDCLPKSEG